MTSITPSPQRFQIDLSIHAGLLIRPCWVSCAIFVQTELAAQTPLHQHCETKPVTQLILSYNLDQKRRHSIGNSSAPCFSMMEHFIRGMPVIHCLQILRKLIPYLTKGSLYSSLNFSVKFSRYVFLHARAAWRLMYSITGLSSVTIKPSEQSNVSGSIR